MLVNESEETKRHSDCHRSTPKQLKPTLIQNQNETTDWNQMIETSAKQGGRR